MMRKATETHKTTVYLEEKVARAVRKKATGTDTSVSSLVNQALKLSLAEDAEDYADIEKRKSEPDIPFDEVVARLKKSGKI
ncbi:MAG: CopG family transcriptional regulator [Candidatus Dadabacteria bacterium]|nr:CopG family transcriptional regulator [Candidatus Dadabacteria bacterium]MCY4047399.1 CopG family transcriptional regulator [Candidatus Dadabacteria bacterium]